MELDFGVAFQEPAKEPEIVDASQVPQAVREMPALNPPPPVKLDLRPIALLLAPYEGICLGMLQEARALTITDEASYQVAADKVTANKKKLKELEAVRKTTVTPYNNHVSGVNNLVRRLTEFLDDTKGAGAIYRRKIKEYLAAQSLQKQRKEAEQREANRRLQEKLDAEAKAQREQAADVIQEAQKKLEEETDPDARATLERTITEETVVLATAAPIVPPVAIEKPTITRTVDGAVFTKDKWKCRIEQPELVPREYCEPSTKLLNAAVKGGIRQIDGCVIEEDLEVNVKA